MGAEEVQRCMLLACEERVVVASLADVDDRGLGESLGERDNPWVEWVIGSGGDPYGDPGQCGGVRDDVIVGEVHGGRERARVGRARLSVGRPSCRADGGDRGDQLWVFLGEQ